LVDHAVPAIWRNLAIARFTHRGMHRQHCNTGPSAPQNALELAAKTDPILGLGFNAGDALVDLALRAVHAGVSAAP
jgi:hypothetical protein